MFIYSFRKDKVVIYDIVIYNEFIAIFFTKFIFVTFYTNFQLSNESCVFLFI